MGRDHNNTNGRNFYGNNDQHNSGGGGYVTSNNFRRNPSYRNQPYMNAPQMYDRTKGRYLKCAPKNNNHVVPGVPKPMVQPLVTVKPAPTSMQTSCLSPSENKVAKAPLAKSQENDISPGWGDVLPR